VKLPASIFFIAALATVSAQLVHVGPTNETAQQYCSRVERIKPNLVLSGATQLSGRIIDQTGAPFKNSVVELRLYVSESLQIPVKTAAADTDGYFNLATVASGQYRLLASPTRAFAQAERLDCGNSGKCLLTITLQANPTDMRASQCPIK
jgi:hypothetical protein